MITQLTGKLVFDRADRSTAVISLIVVVHDVAKSMTGPGWAWD